MSFWIGRLQRPSMLQKWRTGSWIYTFHVAYQDLNQQVNGGENIVINSLKKGSISIEIIIHYTFSRKQNWKFSLIFLLAACNRKPTCNGASIPFAWRFFFLGTGISLCRESLVRSDQFIWKFTFIASRLRKTIA